MIDTEPATTQEGLRIASRLLPRTDRTHAFGHRMSMDRELAVLSSLGTLVCEAKEIERFRPALATSFTSFARIATELDQTNPMSGE